MLDYGTTVYHPPQDLVDFVDARDSFCRFPGCDHPAAVCDYDHRIAFGTGSDAVTAPVNLDPLCRFHHKLKHESGWTHERDPDTGDSIWITPSGTRYGRRATVPPAAAPVEPPPASTTEPDLPPF